MALLSLRGLLKCPKEYASLLYHLNDIAMDIELSKELLYARYNVSAILGKKETCEAVEKDIIKLISPDTKSDKEQLMKQAEDILVKDKNQFLKIKTRNQTIKSETPLEDMRKLLG